MADYFNKVINGTTRPVATTLSAQKLSGATSFTVVAATGWDTGTKVHGIMYRTDAGTGAKVTGSQIDWKGQVSGTTVSSVEITAGTDDTYEIGTTVELSPTAAWGDDIATGILVHADQDGTLKAGAVDNAAVLANDVVETAKIKDLNVTTAKLADGAVTPKKWANPYKFSVYASSTISISTTTQKVTLDTELFDTNNNFDSTTNYRYTVPVTGYYQINAQVAFGSSGCGTTENATAVVRKNGSDFLLSKKENGSGDANKLPRMGISSIVLLTAGDYLELYIVTGGVYRDIPGNAFNTYMNGFLVSET